MRWSAVPTYRGLWSDAQHAQWSVNYFLCKGVHEEEWGSADDLIVEGTRS